MSNKSSKTPADKISEAVKNSVKENVEKFKDSATQSQTNELPHVANEDDDEDYDVQSGIKRIGEEQNLSEDKSVQELTRVPESLHLITKTVDNESGPSFRAEASKETSTSDSVTLRKKDSHQFCRICHEVGAFENFISPCKCKGSLSLVHKWCLERWLAESDTNHCELCGFIYNVYRKPKYNLVSSLLLWIWDGAPIRERRLMMYDAALFALVCPIILFISIFSFQVAESIIIGDLIEKIGNIQNKIGVQLRSEDLQLIASLLARTVQMTIISLMITFDVGFVSWSVMRFQYYIRRWYRWYRRNCNVVLTGYPEMQAPSTLSESSANIRSVTF